MQQTPLCKLQFLLETYNAVNFVNFANEIDPVMCLAN